MNENKVTYLVGNQNTVTNVCEPYSEILIDFLNDLSIKFLKYRDYSDIISLGYYCRRANIQKLKLQYKDDKIRLGRGMVFHITPSNVPINFAFSFIFGILSGCANIVRVPSKEYAQTKIVCNEINEVLKDKKYALIAESTAFITYPADNDITSSYSSLADARIIWGGDNTVKNIKSLPSSARCVDISFSDRYSFMIIDSDKIIKSSEDELKTLAKNFYNDTYFIDQNACSSPNLIVWIGDNVEKAKELFWKKVYDESKKYALEPIKVMDKYTIMLSNAIDYPEIEKVTKMENLIYRAQLSFLHKDTQSCRGKFGLFYEYDCKNLNELNKIVTNKCQTVTYYGDIKEKILTVIMDNKLKGIDRIVPVGQALAIDVIWDGYDIIKTLSRIINKN